MADVNSTQYETFANPVRGKVKTAELGGRVRAAYAQVPDVSGVGSAGDKLNLTWLPKGATVLDAFIQTDGALDTGATSEDIGFGNDTDALFAAEDLSSATTANYAPGFGDLGKEVWELAGYSSKRDAPSNVPVVLEASGAYANTNGFEIFIRYVQD